MQKQTKEAFSFNLKNNSVMSKKVFSCRAVTTQTFSKNQACRAETGQESPCFRIHETSLFSASVSKPLKFQKQQCRHY